MCPVSLHKFDDAHLQEIAHRQYEDGDAGFAVDPKKTALLMIDMQEEFVYEIGGPYRVPEVQKRIPAMAKLLSKFRQHKMPVIHTAFAMTHLYQDRPLRGASMPNRAADTGFDDSHLFREARFVPELAPLDSEVVILKPSYGAFFDTPLETILKRNGLDTVVLVGILTDCCVGTTARQAYERGYGAIVISDATAAALDEFHEAELSILRRSFARVMSADELLVKFGGN